MAEPQRKPCGKLWLPDAVLEGGAAAKASAAQAGRETRLAAEAARRAKLRRERGFDTELDGKSDRDLDKGESSLGWARRFAANALPKYSELGVRLAA